MLNNLPGVTSVHGRFYDLSSKYYRIIGNHAAYYKDALRYLGCVDLKDLPGEAVTDGNIHWVRWWWFRLKSCPLHRNREAGEGLHTGARWSPWRRSLQLWRAGEVFNRPYILCFNISLRAISECFVLSITHWNPKSSTWVDFVQCCASWWSCSEDVNRLQPLNCSLTDACWCVFCSWCILCWSHWETQTSSGSLTRSTPSTEATWRSSRALSLHGANRWWTNRCSTVWSGYCGSVVVDFLFHLDFYSFIYVFLARSLILQHMKPNWCRRFSCCVSWRWAEA